MPLQIPHPDTLLHLYRHILREVTYLPPFCRPWVKDTVQTKFRDHRRPSLKKADHALRFLRSANSGHYDRMRHLFYLATGRKGKRYRELNRTSLAKEPPLNSDALHEDPLFANASGGLTTEKATSSGKDATAPNQVARPRDWLDNWDTAKIQALSKGQIEAGANQVKKMRGNWRPEKAIPKENAWGLPFHPKTARRKELKHYASLLSQILPPLPKGEWDALEALSTGKAEESMYRIPPRRPVAAPTATRSVERPEAAWKWEEYVMKPVRAIERKGSRKMKSLSGVVDDQDPRGPGVPIGVRALKPRAMRRGVYTRVWEACPILDKNAGGKWQATYGGQQRLFSPSPASDLGFFAGIPSNPPPPKPRHKRNQLEGQSEGQSEGHKSEGRSEGQSEGQQSR